MIEVIKNGKEKTYYARCNKCGTEMNYRYNDVNVEKPNRGIGTESRYIICPVCGEFISVNLMTEEEVKKRAQNSLLSYGFSSCC